MQKPDTRIEHLNPLILPTRARRISSIIVPVNGEIPPYILDALQIAHDSIQGGFTVEGTNVLMAQVQLLAVRKVESGY